MRKVVGFSQKTKRAWLDAALDRLAQTSDASELRTFLDKYLKAELPGRESRAKSIGIILRIWSSIPPERVPLRDRAVALLPRISGQERIWLHWGMTALAYPFFRDTAEVIGRLLALQDDFTTAQVQGRMLTTWGDRATNKEAVQKLITSLVDWEVLRSAKSKGHFLLVRKMTASIADVQLWLLEALLGASAADEIEAQQLLRLPESFPFKTSVGVADLRRNDGFNIHRQGLDMDMVALNKLKLESQPKRSKKQKTEKSIRGDQASLFDMEAKSLVTTNGNCKSHAVQVNSATIPLSDNGDDERRRIEDSIKNEVLSTVSERDVRFLQERGNAVVPVGPFAAPLAECVEQFREGLYFGCIALTQAVLEAVVRYIWQVKLKKTPIQEGTFEKNLEALHKKKFISGEWKLALDRMWAERHTLQHLRPSIECNQQTLEDDARKTLKMLNDLKHEFFGYTLRDEMVVPDHPEYWHFDNQVGHITR